MGSHEEAESFFRPRWPEARAVSDPQQQLYGAFGLGNGSAAQLVGPRVWWSGLKSLLKGHGIGRPVGNPLRMSGWVLVDRGEVHWSHLHEHAGAERQWSELERAHTRLLSARG